MADRPPIDFSHLEIRSYLPGGWRLADPDARGRWDPRKSSWTIAVLDTSEVSWDLRVVAKDAPVDRLLLLRTAIDRLYRAALG